MSDIDFEEDGPLCVTFEEAKGIKQYERLKTAFMEDNNVLVHFGAYGLIFGIPQSGSLTFSNLIQYLNLCFNFFIDSEDRKGICQFQGKIGLVSIKHRQAYKHTYPTPIKTTELDGEEVVPAGNWNIVEDNGDFIPFHAVKFLDRFLTEEESWFQVPVSRQPKDKVAIGCSDIPVRESLTGNAKHKVSEAPVGSFTITEEASVRFEKRRHSWNGSPSFRDSSSLERPQNTHFRNEELMGRKDWDENGDNLHGEIQKSDFIRGLDSREIIQMSKAPRRNANGIGSLKERAATGIIDLISSKSSGSRVSSNSSDGKSISDTRSLAGDSGYATDLAESISRTDHQAESNSMGRKRSVSLDSFSVISSGEGDLNCIRDRGRFIRTSGGSGVGSGCKGGFVREGISARTSLGKPDSKKANEPGGGRESYFSFHPSRDSGIFNAFRAKNGDYYERGPRYINPQLEYTRVWDADAKRYATNLVVDGGYFDVLPQQDPRRAVCLFSGRTLSRDPTTGDDSLYPVFHPASIDLWNRKHNERIKPVLRESFPGNDSYPPRLSSVHSPLNLVSATGAVGAAFCSRAISVNPVDKHKIVSFVPIKEGPNFFFEEDIQPFLNLDDMEPPDRPDNELLLEHLQYSLLLRCAWHNANELYQPSSDMHIPEAFRRSIFEADESPSTTLTMDLKLPDGCDPCDEKFQSMLEED